MSQKEMEQLFSQYGRIITSRILVDQVTGNRKRSSSKELGESSIGGLSVLLGLLSQIEGPCVGE